MLHFRVLLVLALALTAVPARAADKSELIPLHYLSAAELDDLLSTRRTPRGLSSRDLVPAGITAWAVDLRKNALSVSGDVESIEQLRRIIRLLDIPARRLQVSVRLVRLDNAGAEALRKEAEALGGEGLKGLVPSDAQKAALDALPPLVAASVDVSNNRRVYLRNPGTANQPARPMTLLPRLNGDNSITLQVTGLAPLVEGKEPVVSLLRVNHKKPLLVLDPENRGWVITAELLPDPVDPAQERKLGL